MLARSNAIDPFHDPLHTCDERGLCVFAQSGWLHLLLLDSPRKKLSVLRRRLFPTRLPGPLDSVFIPAKRLTWGLRLRKRGQYAWYVAGRAAFHLRALLPTLSRMLRIRR